jgi:hypothetical protein
MLKDDIYLIMIVLTVKKEMRLMTEEVMAESMGAVEMNLWCPSHLNLHQDSTSGGTLQRRKCFSGPQKRKRLHSTDWRT